MLPANVTVTVRQTDYTVQSRTKAMTALLPFVFKYHLNPSYSSTLVFE